MHVSRKVPTYLVIRIACAQSKEVLHMVREFRPDAAEIDAGAPVQGALTVFYVSPVPLLERTRLGKRRRSGFARLSSAADLIEDVGDENVPLEVRTAHSCVALQPLTPKELADPRVRRRLRDSMRNVCRKIQQRAQEADNHALHEAKKARREAEAAKRAAQKAAASESQYGRPLWALEA